MQHPQKRQLSCQTLLLRDVAQAFMKRSCLSGSALAGIMPTLRGAIPIDRRNSLTLLTLSLNSSQFFNLSHSFFNACRGMFTKIIFNGRCMLSQFTLRLVKIYFFQYFNTTLLTFSNDARLKCLERFL